MQKGKDFLRAQVSNSIMQHRALMESLSDHIKQAEDKRFRELCERHSSSMLAHQKELDEYGASIGVEAEGGMKEMLGAALGKAKNAVSRISGEQPRVLSDRKSLICALELKIQVDCILTATHTAQPLQSLSVRPTEDSCRKEKIFYARR